MVWERSGNGVEMEWKWSGNGVVNKKNLENPMQTKLNWSGK